MPDNALSLLQLIVSGVVQALLWIPSKPPIRIRFVGIAASTSGEDLHDAIRRADRLLSRAKAEGRACVRS